MVELRAYWRCHSFEENRRTCRKKVREKPIQPLSTRMSSKFLRINTVLYPGDRPSSYNPVQPGLTLDFSIERQHALKPHPSSSRAPNNSTFSPVMPCSLWRLAIHLHILTINDCNVHHLKKQSIITYYLLLLLYIYIIIIYILLLLCSRSTFDIRI